GMEPVEREHGLQLVGRQWRCLVKRPEGIDQPAIKEDPAGSERLIDVLLDVSTQDLLGESESIRSTTRTGRKTFCDDGSSGFCDCCVAHGGKLNQERRLAHTRAAGDHDMRHRSLKSATADTPFQLQQAGVSPTRTQPTSVWDQTGWKP